MEMLDIRNLTVNSEGASCELYMGFGRWGKLVFEKSKTNSGVINISDYEDLEGMDDMDDDFFQAVEEFVDGIVKILSSTINID